MGNDTSLYSNFCEIFLSFMFWFILVLTLSIRFERRTLSGPSTQTPPLSKSTR